MPREDTPEIAGIPAKQPSPGSRLSLRNWKLRSKLALVLIIPTITAIVLGGLSANEQLRQADEFKQTTSQVDLAIRVTDVVHQVQGERMLAVAKIANPGNAELQNALTKQVSDTDSAVSALRDTAATVEIADPSSRERYNRGLERLDALAPLRTSVNTPPYGDQAAFLTYSSVLDSLVQLGREMSASATDRDLLRMGTTIQTMSEAKEFTAREDAALEIAATHNQFSGVLLDQARAAQYRAQAALDLFKSSATPEQLQSYSDNANGSDIDNLSRFAATALARAESPSLGIDPRALAADATSVLGKLRTVESGLLDQLRGNAASLADAATYRAWRSIAIVVAALIAALVLTFVVARAMVKPIRVLRASALEIAYSRLPATVTRILDDPEPMVAAQSVDPVPINTREEIGELARSFDEVHEQAVKMAAEQALLRENVNGIFVNLSRRSQRLVERQLGVIDRLEADEQDPDHLASLFELDHLATRLRRNGESLLVLSGAGLAKSVPKPVSAADVIGAAVSEIEQYARVEVGVIPEVAVRGLTVHDLVHLLAELLDNATYFSEPETKVSVRAAVTRRRALAIQITDRGVGMAEETLAEANLRLADPPDLDVSVTRRMGLYVVARLAQRHGIEVRLRENEDIEGGVIARIVVPDELLGPAVAETPPPAKAETSMPQIPSVPAQRPRPSGEPEKTPTGGLTALAQPISLDDLVAGTSNAAFLSRGTSSAPAPAAPRNGAHAAPPLELPKRQPEYVPVVEPEPAPPEAADNGVFDDAPTKRLPIYQSVVSRWFSETGEETGEVQDTTGNEEPESPMAGNFTEETAVPDEPEQSEPEPAIEETWHSAADEGWQKAQSLLTPKVEETTDVGLPKRVPNAYLVPGSVSTPPANGTAFTDTTSATPGQSAIARSASAARERMVSFQQGYRSGRHAVRTRTGESVSVSGGELSSLEYGSEE